MIKQELIQFLEPFTDEAEIVILSDTNPNVAFPINFIDYRLAVGGNGLMVIKPYDDAINLIPKKN